jgi:signal transduction histidine kinase
MTRPVVGRYRLSVSAQTVVQRLGSRPFSRSELAWPLVLAVWAQLDVWPPAPYNLGHLVGPAPLVALLYSVTSLSLVWRRRAPLAVLVFVVTVDAVEFLAFGAPEGLGSILPAVIAFYSVGRYAPTGEVIVAAPLVLLGVAVHELTDPIFAMSGLEVILWGVVGMAWPIGHAIGRRAREAEGLAVQARELVARRDELASAAVANERARIARELHDVVGHGISVAVLQLVAADGLLDKGRLTAARTRLHSAERSSREALAEMRRLLGLLDGGVTVPEETAGLGHVRRLVADTRAAGAEVTLQVRGDPVDLPAGLDLAAYRILQESLTNVLKHAQPPCADVLIAYERDTVVVEVHDRGATRAEPRPGGRGLTGMRERAALYGGELQVGPRADGGYSVRARLPVGA